MSKSPVKRAPAKGKSKNSKSNTKNNASPTKKISTIPEERRCPVEGCESVGHLGGRLEKHFTQEACPLYHNMTLADTKAWALERQQREEERNKAHILYEPSKKQCTVDQKAYQLKVKELRNKFKPSLTSPTRTSHTNAHFQNQKDMDREPNLTGLVSDYDFQLFREAQARSSEKIEEELKDIQTGKGTKCVQNDLMISVKIIVLIHSKVYYHGTTQNGSVVSISLSRRCSSSTKTLLVRILSSISKM